MRLLKASREDLVVAGDGAVVKRPRVIDAAIVERFEDDRNRLLLGIVAGLEFNAEPLELVRPIARAEAQDEASLGQDVDECGVLDHPDRVLQRQRHHRGAELDALGLRREIGDIGERVGQDAVAVGEMMLGDPGDVVAEPVGGDDFAGHPRMHGAVRVGLALLVGMRGEQDSDLHACLPRRRGS